jgi:hypothetical protein
LKVEDHGIVAARVRPGHEAVVVDASTHGMLIETRCRLLPGRRIELHLETSERRVQLRGLVVRCSVVRVEASSVRYRGAVGFDGTVDWIAANKNP